MAELPFKWEKWVVIIDECSRKTTVKDETTQCIRLTTQRRSEGEISFKGQSLHQFATLFTLSIAKKKDPKSIDLPPAMVHPQSGKSKSVTVGLILTIFILFDGKMAAN